MTQGLWTLLLLVACAAEAGPSHEYPIRSSYDEDGTEIGWYVSHDRFLKTPEWKFDANSSPPLGLSPAYQNAYGWLKQTFPAIGDFKLRSYSLSISGSSSTPNRWYYTFDFTGDLDGSMVMNSRFSVMVLMDGSVVEPRKRE